MAVSPFPCCDWVKAKLTPLLERRLELDMLCAAASAIRRMFIS